MNRLGILVVVVATLAAATFACRPRPKEQMSEDLKKELAALQSEKVIIEDKLRDIERSRSLLKQRTDDELESIRSSIESIRNALAKMQQRLADMDAVPPTVPIPSKHLPMAVSIVLVVIIIFCVLILLKLRSMRSREQKAPAPPESAGGPGESPPQT